MDRGTDACKNHFAECKVMNIRQTRRGWLKELLLGCEAKTEFKYFTGKNQIAHSLEDSDVCERCWFPQCYNWKMVVKEANTDAEIISVHRPKSLCVMACKDCTPQEAIVTSNGEEMGRVKEEYFYCVESFIITDAKGDPKYRVHPPTCVRGMCVNYFTEGCMCGRGMCKIPFWIFDINQEKTDGGDAVHIGKILKKPKSVMTEIFTEANAFEATFPHDADVAAKATLVGASMYFNSVFFEVSFVRQMLSKVVKF